MKLERSVDNLERLTEAARGHHSTGELGRARSSFEEALEMARALGDPASEADLLRNLGTVHRQAGDLPEAQQCYEESLEIAEAAGLMSAVTSALNCLGILTQLRGEVEMATDYYRRARALAESTGDDLRVAMVDQNLATLAQIRGRFDEAVHSYKSAHVRFRALGNHQLTASILTNLGFLHAELQQWVEAENCLDDAFVLAHELRDPSLLGAIELNRANLNIKQNAFDRARDCLDQAFEIKARAGDRGGIADTYVAYGSLFRAMQRPNLAVAHLEKAVDIARGCEERLPEAEAFKTLALVHLGEGRNAEALSCLNTAHKLFLSLQAATTLSELDHRLDGLEETYLAVVEQWAESIEAKDRYTAGHCGRVADYAVRLAA
ncbi:MAG TPA: tetratricopeptide repeat protein, partial [Longimicrobiales bacterium]